MFYYLLNAIAGTARFLKCLVPEIQMDECTSSPVFEQVFEDATEACHRCRPVQLAAGPSVTVKEPTIDEKYAIWRFVFDFYDFFEKTVLSGLNNGKKPRNLQTKWSQNTPINQNYYKFQGINKRFQRLESHVVTLARSVAHLSSEMRSQHLVTQELERLRDDLTTLRYIFNLFTRNATKCKFNSYKKSNISNRFSNRSQAARSQNLYRSTSGNNEPEPPNLTNPKRVKKLTNFFGEDPPLMRLFLKKLGYEVGFVKFLQNFVNIWISYGY